MSGGAAVKSDKGEGNDSIFGAEFDEDTYITFDSIWHKTHHHPPNHHPKYSSHSHLKKEFHYLDRGHQDDIHKVSNSFTAAAFSFSFLFHCLTNGDGVPGEKFSLAMITSPIRSGVIIE